MYGLQLPAHQRRRRATGSIEELAHRYVDGDAGRSSRAARTDLLGWSLGGVIAHAMAVELQAAAKTSRPSPSWTATPRTARTRWSAGSRSGTCCAVSGSDSRRGRWDLTYEHAARVARRVPRDRDRSRPRRTSSGSPRVREFAAAGAPLRARGCTTATCWSSPRSARGNGAPIAVGAGVAAARHRRHRRVPRGLRAQRDDRAAVPRRHRAGPLARALRTAVNRIRRCGTRPRSPNRPLAVDVRCVTALPDEVVGEVALPFRVPAGLMVTMSRARRFGYSCARVRARCAAAIASASASWASLSAMP